MSDQPEILSLDDEQVAVLFAREANRHVAIQAPPGTRPTR
jgi:hypothetical protein